jgi:probable HAF family extracellular repeat protein
MEVIPPLSGSSWAEAHDMNSLGEVTGQSDSDHERAFLYSNGQTTEVTPPDGFPATIGFAINDSHHLAISGRALRWEAFLISESGATDIGTLGGALTEPAGMNGADHIVGNSSYQGWTRAFLWTPEGGMRNLGVLDLEGPYPVSRAIGVNDTDEVVGYSGPYYGYSHAFLWTAQDGMRDLGTLGGPYSFALGINSARQIVGYAATPSLVSHAVAWVDGAIVDLGTVTPNHRAEATSINSQGQVVGWAYPADFSNDNYLGFFYDLNTGEMQILNDALSPPRPDLDIDGVSKINDSGQILAQAHVIGTGHGLSMVLTPCP